MDFQPTEDQKALREGVRSFLEGQVPFDRFPALEKSKGFDAALWGELAEMGVFALRLAEDEGGIGLGFADAILVFAELGRRLIPGPIVWSHLAAGLIDGAATGEVVVGGVDLIGPRPDPIVLEHLDSLDVLLVLRPEGIERVNPRDIEATEIETPLDSLTPVHHAPTLPAGEIIGDAAAAARMRRQPHRLTDHCHHRRKGQTSTAKDSRDRQEDNRDHQIGTVHQLGWVSCPRSFARQRAAVATTTSRAGHAALWLPPLSRSCSLHVEAVLF